MMTVQQIFDLGLKIAINADPRGRKAVEKRLVLAKKQYEDMKPSEKEYFDTDRFTNPYPDCAIHVNDGATKVKRVLAGIDISASEILLASQLNERGKPIDLVISHHPEGKALACLHEVMDMIGEVYVQEGVPVHVAEKMMEERMKEVGRGVHPANHFAAIDVARHLGINFMSTHTITDNLVDQFSREYLKKKKPEFVADIIAALLELPEYKQAKQYGAGPKIIAGGPTHRVGRYLVEMTGGTNPSSKVYERLSQYGISTVVGMHMRDDSMNKASESHMNVVIAGHMSSDSLGMNLFLDELEKQDIDIVPCGGLIRVSRNKPAAKKKK
jgi:putative NIF3 family GTP cyclohydrolase 1 type 2